MIAYDFIVIIEKEVNWNLKRKLHISGICHGHIMKNLKPLARGIL